MCVNHHKNERSTQKKIHMVMIIFPTVVDFRKKQSPLCFHQFLLFFWLERLLDRLVALRDCLREGSIRLYRIAFVGSGFLHRKRQAISKRLKLLVKNGREVSVSLEHNHEQII